MWNPFKRKEKTPALVEYEDSQSLVKNESGAFPCEVASCNSNESLEIMPMSGDNTAIARNNGDKGGLTSVDAKLKVAEMGIDLAKQALDVYNTSLMVEQNIAAIRASSEVQLAQIASKYEFCRSTLEHVFKDRHSGLAAHYCVLDNAMKSNDREMVLAALRGISSIVVSSPLSDFKDVVNNWDSYSKEKPLELDF